MRTQNKIIFFILNVIVFSSFSFALESKTNYKLSFDISTSSDPQMRFSIYDDENNFNYRYIFCDDKDITLQDLEFSLSFPYLKLGSVSLNNLALFVSKPCFSQLIFSNNTDEVFSIESPGYSKYFGASLGKEYGLFINSIHKEHCTDSFGFWFSPKIMPFDLLLMTGNIQKKVSTTSWYKDIRPQYRYIWPAISFGIKENLFGFNALCAGSFGIPGFDGLSCRLEGFFKLSRFRFEEKLVYCSKNFTTTDASDFSQVKFDSSIFYSKMNISFELLYRFEIEEIDKDYSNLYKVAFNNLSLLGNFKCSFYYLQSNSANSIDLTFNFSPLFCKYLHFETDWSAENSKAKCFDIGSYFLFSNNIIADISFYTRYDEKGQSYKAHLKTGFRKNNSTITFKIFTNSWISLEKDFIDNLKYSLYLETKNL